MTSPSPTNQATNLQVWSNALPALRALNERGIPVIVLKSLPQIEELYGNLQERLTLDVDLCVPGARILDAYRACQAAGFEAKTGSHYPDLNALAQDGGLETALRARKWTLVPAANPDGYDIDLHNDQIAPWRSAALRASVWEHAQERSRDGVTFLTLSPEDRLIFLCWTIAAEDFKRRKTQDIARILQAGNLDWGHVRHQSELLGLTLIVQLVCDLSAAWWGLDVHPHWNWPASTSVRLRRRLLRTLLKPLITALDSRIGLIAQILSYDHPWAVWGAPLRLRVARLRS